MVHCPSLLPTNYYRAILGWSRYFTEDKIRVRQLHDHNYLMIYNKFIYSKNLMRRSLLCHLQLFFRIPSDRFLACSSGFHPGSCHTFALKDFLYSLFLYFKIYLAIYSLPLLLFRTKSIFTHTTDTLSTLLPNTLVSALFLAVDGTLVKYTLCLLRNWHGKAPPLPLWIAPLSGFLGAAGLLIERHSRRLELLYYVLPQVNVCTNT